MIWKAWLTGHEFDLHELGQLFSSGDTHVAKDGDEYYLASVEIDSRPTAEAHYEAASRVLALVNGVGQANNSGFRPVALSGTYNEGNQVHQVAMAGTAEARSYAYATASVFGPDGTERPDPPPPGPERVAKATRHPDAAEALQIMGKAESTTWVDLYKVYEIIKSAGGLRSAAAATGASDGDLAVCRRSANHPDASGPDSRHARSNEQAPKNPMAIGHGRDFIGRLLTTWLDSLH